MAKYNNPTVIDQALTYLKTNGTRLCVCSTQPTTYAEAITTYKLAIKTITSSDYTGPAGGASGNARKVQTNAQAGLTIDSTGDAQHIAIADSGNSALLYVTTCTLQTLTSGGTVDVPAFELEIATVT